MSDTIKQFLHRGRDDFLLLMDDGKLRFGKIRFLSKGKARMELGNKIDIGYFDESTGCFNESDFINDNESQPKD